MVPAVEGDGGAAPGRQVEHVLADAGLVLDEQVDLAGRGRDGEAVADGAHRGAARVLQAGHDGQRLHVKVGRVVRGWTLVAHTNGEFGHVSFARGGERKEEIESTVSLAVSITHPNLT